ncbi:5'-methylthioadenosine/S-adenosylhomocysteine nucleosidase [Frankliniella fusca]|uniref:5'-methylthioadenosine/S-adenosylhomocysteine nucleosidase n=1 Tax=Frankliniella fusca TaxID=407009 RepID=A0AAE1I2G0_9NEOP|nr:5'-methylthioadenosine/S-adenosylhomocysteine nucleosidase [Frankliniella fusca]
MEVETNILSFDLVDQTEGYVSEETLKQCQVLTRHFMRCIRFQEMYAVDKMEVDEVVLKWSVKHHHFSITPFGKWSWKTLAVLWEKTHDQ